MTRAQAMVEQALNGPRGVDAVNPGFTEIRAALQYAEAELRADKARIASLETRLQRALQAAGVVPEAARIAAGG